MFQLEKHPPDSSQMCLNVPLHMQSQAVGGQVDSSLVRSNFQMIHNLVVTKTNLNSQKSTATVHTVAQAMYQEVMSNHFFCI